MAKKGKRKGKKKDKLASAMTGAIAKSMGGKVKRGKRKDMRPTSFLKKMAAKMERNLPRLKSLIASADRDGRPAT